MIRRVIQAVAAALLVTGALVVVSPQAAVAGCKAGDTDCPEGGTTTDDDTDVGTSDGTKQARYNSGAQSCSVYANGAGMGMYCVGLGGGTLKTLRERYGKQKLQECRYSEIPSTIQVPFNSRPDEGRYMLMSCLSNIDFDTYAGGKYRSIDISIVFVPNGTDIEDRHNEISDFLWKSFDRTAQMPVPFMRTKPNVTPIVGIPTYFTFRWIDPTNQKVVAQGPYAGRADGGPYRQITTQGVVMRAQAVKVVVDPNQEGIPAVTCDPETPYREGASPKDQPADACSITFPRSSASARKYATKGIPESVDDAFYASVEVTWRVTYGDGSDMDQLGQGFTMRLRQVIPVQEIQAPNQPPTVIY